MIEESSLREEISCGPIAVNAFGEKYFFNLNRNSFDKASAFALFESQFGKILFKEDVLIVVVGTDSGLLPKFIQQKPLPKGSRYIFIEPEPVLAALNAENMLNDLDDQRIVCISLDDWPLAIQTFKIRDYFYINAVQSINAICAQDDYIQEYAQISWHITEVLSQLHWQNTIELGSEAFISRQIHNSADNILPAKLLENAFQNKTVVLLAGGPSLDDVLPWIKLHRQQLVLFAVSRIARQLIQAQIQPDFVFSVDPTELSFDVSKEMLNFGAETTFICSHHTVPALINQWPGLSLYLGARFPWKSALNEVNLSSAGPTVTNTALNIAYDFGFKRIILAGVDLCFTREGATHAKGSNEDLAGPRFNLTSLQVETNNGLLAPTSCDFVQAISSLALQAKILVSKHCKIINISAHAAKVEYIEYMPVSELKLDAANLDVSAIIYTRISKAKIGNLFYSKVIEELKRAQYQVKAIAKLAETARHLNDEMYSQQGVIENYKDKKNLDQIEKKFKREYRQFSKLVKKFGIRRFIKLTKPFNDEDWSAEEAKQLGNVYYDVYQEGAAKLLILIEDAIARVSARQEEFAEQPDFVKLLAQSRKDHSYGRVRIWQKKYSFLDYPEEITAEFTDFESRFVEILNEKNTRHFQNAKKHSSLTILKQRAGVLFKHRKTEELQDLRRSLDNYTDKTAALPYRYLIEAYLAELQNQPEVALMAYQQIIHAGDILLEEALTRIAGIGVQQNEMGTANLALQCLSQLNPVYLPFYAELQRLQGEVLPAIDAYSSYISRFPEDTLVQIKLIMIYVEQKVYDAAELMLDFILQKHPGLDVAVNLKSQLLQLQVSNCNG